MPRLSCLFPLFLCLPLFTLSTALTFLVVDKNLASPSREKPVNASSAGLCGGSCFEAAQEGQCIAFVWREEQETNTSADALAADGQNNRGRCGLLKCIPDPEDFSPSPGAFFYLVVRGSGRMPFNSIRAPDSYKVVCNYAYRVYDKLDFTYEEARGKCAKDGARLFAFTDESQQQYLNDRVNPAVAYWVGMDDLLEEGTFVMSNGLQRAFNSHGIMTPWNQGLDTARRFQCYVQALWTLFMVHLQTQHSLVPVLLLVFQYGRIL